MCFSLGTHVFSTNKSDGHNITEILLKVVLNTNIIDLFVFTENKSQGSDQEVEYDDDFEEYDSSEVSL